MLTQEEIKKIKVEISDRLYSIFGYSTAIKRTIDRAIDEILEDYCIVRKREVREDYQLLKNKYLNFNFNHIQHYGFLGGMTVLELIFGKSHFDEI